MAGGHNFPRVQNEQVNLGRRLKEKWCGMNEEPSQSGRRRVSPIGG